MPIYREEAEARKKAANPTGKNQYTKEVCVPNETQTTRKPKRKPRRTDDEAASKAGVSRRKIRLARRVERRQYRRHARPIPPRLSSRAHRALADHRRHRGGLVWHRRADSVAHRELSGTAPARAAGREAYYGPVLRSVLFSTTKQRKTEQTTNASNRPQALYLCGF